VQFHAKYPLFVSQSDREFTFSYAILRFIWVNLKIGVNQNSTCALEQQWPYKFTTFIAGGTPYPAINNKELRNLLNSGYRLERPESCSEEL